MISNITEGSFATLLDTNHFNLNKIINDVEHNAFQNEMTLIEIHVNIV
jgi:hypothetical protein